VSLTETPCRSARDRTLPYLTERGEYRRMDIVVISGDITTQQVDAIVNAANSAMRGGGGVDGAIHRAGGRAIIEDCIARYPDGLPTGSAGWTTAGELPARWVIHVVGPNYRAGERDRRLLTSCYSNALRVADELGARTVAFPLVSAGIYGWPLQDAADAAVETLRATHTGVELARLVAFGDEAYSALRLATRRHQQEDPTLGQS
jgi:O-acetyl-ADP-ribose deacetylase